MKIAILTSLLMFSDPRASGLRLVSVSIYFALKRMGYEVELITSNSYKEHYFTYNRLLLEEEALKQNFYTKDLKVNTRSFVFPFILPKRQKLQFQYKTEAVDINSYSHIITSFVEWDKIINYNLNPNVKVFNIYHDNIQESYRFLKQWSALKTFNSVQTWQKNMHYSEKIICISSGAKEQFKACFGEHASFKEEKLEVLPPSVLPLFYETTEKVRENAVLIGNMFDERKKPLDAIEIINKMECIEKLYIYGSPRCKKSLIRKIFSTLRKDIEVQWIMQASTKTTMDLFSRAKVLLFPSEFEGLGLPIIEAQVCGCPVMTRNKAPMKDLILPGSMLMSGDVNLDAKALDNLFKNFSENEILQKQARSEFDVKKLESFLKSIL